ncbi:hypothetical protein L6R29_16375 [Myxococcota bacterium]|nr:hypothetical protein [Myxococcota bacterium]
MDDCTHPRTKDKQIFRSTDHPCGDLSGWRILAYDPNPNHLGNAGDEFAGGGCHRAAQEFLSRSRTPQQMNKQT